MRDRRAVRLDDGLRQRADGLPIYQAGGLLGLAVCQTVQQLLEAAPACAEYFTHGLRAQSLCLADMGFYLDVTVFHDDVSFSEWCPS
jgi:hypothetical protein